MLEHRADALDELRDNLRALASLRLYWVTTEDHDEDWFVLAPDGATACAFFEAYEGYDPDTAEEEFVTAVPSAVIAQLAREHAARDSALADADDPIAELLARPRGWDPTSHPSRATLEACGGEFLLVSQSFDDDHGEDANLRAAIRDALGEGEPRIVRFGDRVFGEGDIVANPIASVRAAGLL